MERVLSSSTSAIQQCLVAMTTQPGGENHIIIIYLTCLCPGVQRLDAWPSFTPTTSAKPTRRNTLVGEFQPPFIFFLPCKNPELLQLHLHVTFPYTEDNSSRSHARCLIPPQKKLVMLFAFPAALSGLLVVVFLLLQVTPAQAQTARCLNTPGGSSRNTESSTQVKASHATASPHQLLVGFMLALKTLYPPFFLFLTRCVAGTIVCQVCKKEFKKTDALRRHKRTHASHKPVLVCPRNDCQAYFSTTFNLQHHIRKVHLNLLKYKCAFPDCPRTFAMRVRNGFLNH